MLLTLQNLCLSAYSSSNLKESKSNKIKPSFIFPKAKATSITVGFLTNLIHRPKSLEVSEVYTGGISEVHSFAC
jgi:hypothetical protein